MKYFHFHVPTDNIKFDAPLQSFRCKQITKNGNRCKNHVLIGTPYCWMHQKYKHFLCVKESTIPNAGLGVFACKIDSDPNTIVFHRGQKICDFDGQIISIEDKNNRYGKYTAPYGLQLHKNLIEDGAIHRGIGSLINYNPHKINCRFSISKHNTGQIIATKNIKNNTELFVSYGKSYHINEQGVSYGTNWSKYHL